MKLKKYCGNCEVEWLDDECSTEEERCARCNLHKSEWKPCLYTLENDLEDFILDNI